MALFYGEDGWLTDGLAHKLKQSAIICAMKMIESASQELIKHIKSLPPAEYSNKREVAAVLAEGVRNGRDPEIRQAQIDFAARAKTHGHESHTYSSGWGTADAI